MQKNHAAFTKEMRQTHTIYMPQMLYYHNALLKAAFSFAGYHLDVVPEYKNLTNAVYQTVHPDYCTCAIGIVGNLLTMLEDPSHKDEKIAFLEPQVGGACRAGNYYNLIINCLKETGHDEIPVISLNWKGLEKHSGFKISLKLILACVAAVCCSDILMSLLLQIRPYEATAGETEALYEKWISGLSDMISHGRLLFFRKHIYQKIVRDFSKIQINRDLIGTKKKVGIVGEIYIKFSPIGNCHLEELLQKNDCEYRLGGFVNYCIFVLHSEMISAAMNGGSFFLRRGYAVLYRILLRIQKQMNDVMQKGGFIHDGSFEELKRESVKIISEEYVIGDGWLTTAEIIDHINNGYDRVLTVHPFGCLVSHVGSRGVLKKVKKAYPGAKVHSIEYDREQSEAMRESRILLVIN